MASDMRLIEFCTEVEVVRLVFLGGAEGKLGRRRRGTALAARTALLVAKRARTRGTYGAGP